MKSAIAVILSILFVLSVAAPSFARMGSMGRAMTTIMPVKQVEGEIESVDAKAGTVTVKGMRGPVTADVDERSVIKIGEEVKTLADVKAGQHAVLFFEGGEGKNILKSLLVSVPASPEKKSEPTSEEKK